MSSEWSEWGEGGARNTIDVIAVVGRVHLLRLRARVRHMPRWPHGHHLHEADRLCGWRPHAGDPNRPAVRYVRLCRRLMWRVCLMWCECIVGVMRNRVPRADVHRV